MGRTNRGRVAGGVAHRRPGAGAGGQRRAQIGRHLEVPREATGGEGGVRRSGRLNLGLNFSRMLMGLGLAIEMVIFLYWVGQKFRYAMTYLAHLLGPPLPGSSIFLSQ